MPKPISDRIAEIKARQKELAARQSLLEAKAKKEAKDRELRRKVVIGGAILAAIEKEPALVHQVGKVLAKYVERDGDRDVVADLLSASPARPGE